MPDVERIAAELRAIIDHDASLGLKPPLHAEIRALLDELARQGEALKLAREALDAMVHAVCGESGFANAVRVNSGFAYPWPALDEAEALAIEVIMEKTDEKYR
ncbi:hypothetical protein [Mesorhizobium sp. M4B.F.Ca.ET.058.02.1.1]|uniref:hypothetical protein n=1 Tax=Mesorhizobium sp. M4B.F.Ca.ET.058.02.1.1 TaxID=2493675 RepID=UPI000F75BD99|nr:hypothetical protein [Mesorhizobium sp. M4B.F.Ca.ET.058.02.1.1]AZO48089.1 hypothetical protein EJ073_09860 [Mesorhizobium sp. M4B.F.Ca.ET.058.02.1.1]